ncbi:MAG: yliI 4 [Alphaproteobacteria bacterium]|nr:yliI 4 [Alphaproteobacteria bacterium]
MKKYLVSAAVLTALCGAALAQSFTPPPPPPLAPTDIKLPAHRMAVPVPALRQTRAFEIFTTTCSGCHGQTLEPGAKAKSLFTASYLDSRSDAQIVNAVTDGTGITGHGFKTLLTPDEILQMPSYLRIVSGNLNRKMGAVPDITGKVLKTQKATFKVETLAKGLDQPWGFAFLPDGRMIFTERAGRIRFLDKAGKLSEPVKGTPTVFVRQDGGMLDIALHPDFAKNGWIYLSYTTVPPGYAVQPGEDKAPNLSAPTMTWIVRGKVNAANEWVDQQVLFQPPEDSYRTSADHYGSRFLFDGKGHFFWSMGERHDFQMSQNLASPLGKIHRLNDDGSIPKDNPFVNTPGALGSIWTYGHRNPEGLTFDPATGLFWETEHGPTGGDEVNIIEPGHDYGWGVASKGLEPGIMRQSATGMTDPITFYNPSIGPSGTNFYTGDKFPGWKGNLFVSAMVGQKLIRLEIKDRQIVSQEAVFADYGRVREAKTGPDGYLYALLQNQNGDPKGGSIIRLVPAK